jgi:hypothetical protein
VVWISKLFDNYVKYNIHVGLAVLALAQITAMDFNLYLPFSHQLILFVAPFLAYNFIKFHLFFIAGIGSKIKGGMIFFGLTIFIIVWFVGEGLQLPFSSLIILLLTLLLVLLYCLPLPGFTINFRGFKGLKIHLVALSWVLTTVFLPFSMGGQEINDLGLVYGFQRYLFVLVATLPFEIRDMKSDDSHLSTWPQKWGIRNTKILGTILLSAFVGLELIYFPLLDLTTTLLVAGVLTIFLIKSKAEQSKYFSSFWVEAIPILWLLLKVFNLVI